MALSNTWGEVNDVAVVSLNGRIVLGEVTVALREKVKGLLGEGKKKRVLNLNNVTFIPPFYMDLRRTIPDVGKMPARSVSKSLEEWRRMVFRSPCCHLPCPALRSMR
jgi:hypothetical protein